MQKLKNFKPNETVISIVVLALVALSLATPPWLWRVASAFAVFIVGACLTVAALGATVISLRAMDLRARQIQHDGGLFPLLSTPQGIYDPNRDNPGHPAVAQDALRVQQAAALRAHAGTRRPATHSPYPLVEEEYPEEEPDPLPHQVSLQELLPAEAPSLQRLALGVSANGPVYESMSNLVHIAVGGSSGFGKSVFLRALTYQLALAQEQPELALIDLEGVTFSPFRTCARLKYPIADNEQDAALLLEAISQQELNHRKQLFNEYPGVDSLARYNAANPATPLNPIIVLIDEGTALLGDKDVESALKTLTLRARKYGLWVVLAGQDWKYSSLDTAIRNQLSSVVQFRARSAAQSRVLLNVSGAETLPADPKGRALAQLPGHDLVELQTPYISHRQLLQNLPMTTSAPAAPQLASDPTEERIRALHADGVSDTGIAREVFGHGTTFYIEKVRAVLC